MANSMKVYAKEHQTQFSGPPPWETHQILVKKTELAYEYDVADNLLKAGYPFQIDFVQWSEGSEYGSYWTLYTQAEVMHEFTKGTGKDKVVELKPVTELQKVYLSCSQALDDVLQPIREAKDYPITDCKLELVHFIPKSQKEKANPKERTFYRLVAAEGEDVAAKSGTSTHKVNPNDALGDLDEHPF